MTDEAIRARLLALTTEDQRSVIDRLETLLPEIEAAFAAGAKRAAILEILHDEGLEIEPALFSTYLHRLRTRKHRHTIPVPPLTQRGGTAAGPSDQPPPIKKATVK